MKKPLYILLICLLASGFSSCKKWLDVKPGTQVLQDEMFSTEAGFNQALLGSYLQMGTGLYADNLTMTTISAMGQNYQTTSTGHPLLEHAKYNYAAPTVKASIATIWSNMYKAIGGINNILAHVDQAKGIFFKNHYNLVKGEALGLRAYMHFDLLRMFGPVPINNGSVNAIPYVTTFDKQVTLMSNTNQVIELCLKDLDEAEQLLSVYQDIAYNTGDNVDEFTNYTRNHFNYWAVKALKARIYLYAANKAKAYQYAKEVIASAKFPFVDRSTFNLSSNQDRTFSTEHVFALNLPLIKALVDIRFRLDGNTSFQTQTFYLTSATMNTLFDVATGGSTDYRYLYNIKTSNGYSYSTKFWQDGISSLQLSNQVPLIRLSEMYYIAAESTPNLTEALELVNKIRTQRALTAIVTPFNETTRMQEIAKEYVKEFYAEGQLFFYYKRLGTLPVPRSAVVMTEKTYVFPLPDNEIEFGNR
ncbi:RagB/SusD family nutrient uptake outer membrane protein [Pedobacter sp. MC2016-24]|uniref:RagB/SusD family nutrient uptake outer membrane protein n=1 Tax=Pedobacter sp. MC2016-24 TaxID=2780090 RepID=UPI0018819E94|nr:RagB/SusD family nutrient uptake outer membrane protein [Pedobacter sp. MC2016-24]MBE9599265.1 RagB/SusD family nutrient uptake outer membrane protein [Pedobacter sp. MC2016-24]